MKFLSDILAKAGLTVDGVVTLNNTATGQTPDANDNSTKLATTAWVRTFVQPYSLPIASASVLGGVKVGSGLSINSSTGVLSVTGGGAASIKSTQTFIATAGQTVFTISGGYTAGLIDVFLNGVYLSPNQTTATNGTTVTLSDAALAGDIIDVIIAAPIYQGATTTTDQLPEGVVNLYYTDARSRAAISLTVTGTSGASTYDSGTGVLNIPTYTLAGLGGVPTSRTLTIDGVSYDLSTNRTWNILPTGGAAGDILAKNSATNYDVAWIPNYTSQVQHTVKLAEAMTIGTPVYVSGSTGQAGTNMLVSKASNASEGTSSKTLGLIAFTGVTNDTGFVITEGLLAGLDTSAAGAAGDPVWLGPSGTLIYGLLNKPTAPAHLVFIGVVTRKQQNNGEIFVKVQNGYELEELHNLSVASPSDGDMIKYVASTGLWTKIAATTTNITEGTNLYYTQARFDTAFAAKSTTNLAEGTNLYYTNARARAAISVTGSGSYDSATGVITVTGGVTSVNTLTGAVTLTTTNIGEGTNLYYTTARVNSDFDTRLATKSTTNLAEGTNLYYTDARVGTYLTTNSYATQSYVSTQINNLVSGAPGLLDTLDELAAALGDDPNFATTVSTALSNRLRIDIGTQGLTSTQQGYGRTNLGLGSLATLSSIGNSYITDLAYSKLTGVPSTFAPSAHTHPISDITGLQTALDGKQASLSGTGFVKISGSTISYDNSTYYLASNPSGYITGISFANVSAKPTTLSGYGITDGTKWTSGRTTADLNTLGLSNASSGIYSLSNNANAPASSLYGTLYAFWNEDISTQLYVSYNGSMYWRPSVGAAYTGASWRTVWDSTNLTNLNQLTNGPGYLTGITFSQVTTALGFTPAPSGYGLGNSAIVGSGYSISNYTLTGFYYFAGATGIPTTYFQAGILGSSNGDYAQYGIGSNQEMYFRWSTGTWKKVWTDANLTNLNQLTNGPGYITGYTETDTLATVTARGATTTVGITVNSADWNGISTNNGAGITTPKGAFFANAYPSTTDRYYAQFSGNWASSLTWGLGVRGTGDDSIYFARNTSGVLDVNSAIKLYVGPGLVLHTSNYSTYALPKTGGALTGNLTFSTQGSKIIFGDSTSASPSMIGEGLVDTEGSDSDFLTIYARNSLRIYSTGVNERVRIDNTGLRVYGTIIKDGGTSSQFLKADGSIDSSTYLTSYTESDTLNSVMNRGNTTSATITFNATYSQSSPFTFMKATYGGGAYCGIQFVAYNPANGIDSSLGLQVMNSSGGYVELLKLNGNAGTVSINSNTILHAANYSSYSLPLSGGTVSGVLYGNGGGNFYIYNYGRIGLPNAGRILYNNGTGANMFFGEIATDIYGFTGNLYSDTPTLAMNVSSRKVTINGSSPTGTLTVQASADGNMFSVRGSLSGYGYPNIIEMGQSGADGYFNIKDGAGNIQTSLSGYTGTASYFLTRVLIGTTTNLAGGPYGILSTRQTTGTLPSIVATVENSTSTNDGTILIGNLTTASSAYRLISGYSGNGSTDNFSVNQFYVRGDGYAYFKKSVNTALYSIAPNGTANLYNIVDADYTFAGSYTMQAGGGSTGYGGSITTWGHSHASRPGYVSAGISAGSGGKFTVMNGGNGSGSDIFTVSSNGNVAVTGTLYADGGMNIGASVKFRWGGNTTPTLGHNIGGSDTGNSLFIEVADSDTGGLCIQNDGTTVYGAGDAGFVFRVIDEDSFQGGGGAEANTCFKVNQGAGGGGYIKGDFTATGDVIAYSDIRVKENIKPLTSALSKVLELNGYYYNRTDLKDKSTKIGFIAQEVKNIVPELVTYDSLQDRYSVSYGNATALLVEAIKEQQTQIESQKTEIEELKDLVKQLINR